MSNESSASARNHHFVPQYYLKGFAKPRSKDGRLTVFDLKDRKSFITRPRNVASRRDYNRVEIDGVDPNVVESQLSVLEAQADQAFRRIIEARSIDNSDDFSLVLSLIGQVSLNNPLFRDQRDKMISQLGTVMMHNMVETPERWNAVTDQARVAGELDLESVTYEDARDAVLNGDIVAGAAKEVLIQQEIELWPQILPLLHARKWTLLIAPPGSGGFATSDRPFSLRWNDYAMNQGPYGVGLGCTDTTLTFPLNRELALIGSFEHGGGTSEATEDVVAAVNHTIFRAAMRQLYTTVDFPILDVGRVIKPFSESRIWQIVRERPED